MAIYEKTYRHGREAYKMTDEVNILYSLKMTIKCDILASISCRPSARDTAIIPGYSDWLMLIRVSCSHQMPRRRSTFISRH